jgi:hypothetical protein
MDVMSSRNVTLKKNGARFFYIILGGCKDPAAAHFNTSLSNLATARALI